MIATGTYSDASTQTITGSVTWASGSPAVATISSGGLAHGVAAGTSTISATLGAISGNTLLTVTAPTLVSIAVTPANPTIAAGANQQMIATGTYSDASTQTITGSVTWASGSPAVATISSGGLAHGVAAGTSTISATLGAISGNTLLTVTAPTLVSIAVTPANPTIAAGANQQMIATGTYSDASTQTITGSVTWASGSPAVATISSGGLAHGVAAGTSTISATLGAISGNTLLTVTAPTLVSIAVTPANPTIAAGANQQMIATGTYSDASTQTITGSVTWASGSPAVATISSGGLAHGVAAGTSHDLGHPRRDQRQHAAHGHRADARLDRGHPCEPDDRRRRQPADDRHRHLLGRLHPDHHGLGHLGLGLARGRHHLEWRARPRRRRRHLHDLGHPRRDQRQTLLTVTAPTVNITVDSTSDLGDSSSADGVCQNTTLPAGARCTLRAAIQQANATVLPVTITFAPGVTLITPGSALPTITHTVTISACVSGAPTVQLAGSSAGAVNGLTLGAGSSGSLIEGLAMRNWIALTT